MDVNEIVKTLKLLAEDTEFVFAREALDAAADLIESIQAQLARLTAERTAMLKALQGSEIDCDSCKHNGIGDCEDIDPDCGTCAQDCHCKWCDGISNWEWRGAEEG